MLAVLKIINLVRLYINVLLMYNVLMDFNTVILLLNVNVQVLILSSMDNNVSLALFLTIGTQLHLNV